MSSGATAASAAAALGCTLVAGVFFGFATFVMPALDSLGNAPAADAMRAINVKAVGPGLMVAMFGTALIVIAVAVIAVGEIGEIRGKLMVAGAALYLVGCFGVTIAGNVPLNETLEEAGRTGTPAAIAWADFLGPWNAWNVTRTVASLGAAACLIAATVA